MDKQQVEAAIAQGLTSGWLIAGCPTCDKRCAEARERGVSPSQVMCPSHFASPRCESGKHDHCTCDTCF